MEVQPDFRELLVLLNEYEVEYIIVGAFALAFHGAPRFTGDIDILIRPESENAKRLLTALDVFGFGHVGLTVDDFLKPDYIVQLGVPPVRIDLITSITGVTWEDANAGKVTGRYIDISVFYLGRNEYTINKRALGRNKDLADLGSLGEK